MQQLLSGFLRILSLPLGSCWNRSPRKLHKQGPEVAQLLKCCTRVLSEQQRCHCLQLRSSWDRMRLRQGTTLEQFHPTAGSVAPAAARSGMSTWQASPPFPVPSRMLKLRPVRRGSINALFLMANTFPSPASNIFCDKINVFVTLPVIQSSSCCSFSPLCACFLLFWRGKEKEARPSFFHPFRRWGKYFEETKDECDSP